MKKYLSLLLACVLALALLCACGKKDAAEQTPAPETPPTQTAATGGVDTSCKLYFPNDAADDLSADTAQIPDTEPAVTVAYAQAIVAQPMSDWTVYRIDGQTLQDMGRSE